MFYFMNLFNILTRREWVQVISFQRAICLESITPYCLPNEIISISKEIKKSLMQEPRFRVVAHIISTCMNLDIRCSAIYIIILKGKIMECPCYSKAA